MEEAYRVKSDAAGRFCDEMTDKERFLAVCALGGVDAEEWNRAVLAVEPEKAKALRMEMAMRCTRAVEHFSLVLCARSQNRMVALLEPGNGLSTLSHHQDTWALFTELAPAQRAEARRIVLDAVRFMVEGGAADWRPPVFGDPVSVRCDVLEELGLVVPEARQARMKDQGGRMRTA